MVESMKSDGGPAFPSTNDVVIGGFGTTGHPGMSLRDWFAGQALAGISYNYHETGGTPQQVANWAYNYADAMLKARED